MHTHDGHTHDHDLGYITHVHTDNPRIRGIGRDLLTHCRTCGHHTHHHRPACQYGPLGQPAADYQPCGCQTT